MLTLTDNYVRYAIVAWLVDINVAAEDIVWCIRVISQFNAKSSPTLCIQYAILMIGEALTSSPSILYASPTCWLYKAFVDFAVHLRLSVHIIKLCPLHISLSESIKYTVSALEQNNGQHFALESH